MDPSNRRQPEPLDPLSLQSSYLICRNFIGVVASQPHRGERKNESVAAGGNSFVANKSMQWEAPSNKVAVLFFIRRIL